MTHPETAGPAALPIAVAPQHQAATPVPLPIHVALQHQAIGGSPSPTSPLSVSIVEHGQTSPTVSVAADEPITGIIVNPSWLWAHGLFLLQPLGCIICVECDHGLLANEVPVHLEKIHQVHTLSVAKMNQFAKEHALPLSRKRFILPKQPLYEVAGLTVKHGFICTVCRYIRAEKNKVVVHIEEQHAGGAGVKPRPCTFHEVFAVNHGSRIEVVAPRSPEQRVTLPAEILRKHLLCHPQYYHPPLTSRPDPRTVHPFLRISGWQVYVQGMEPTILTHLKELMKPTKEMQADCRALLEDLHMYCTPDSYTPRCFVASPLK